MDLGPALKVAPVATTAPIAAAHSGLGAIEPATELAAPKVVQPVGLASEAGLDPQQSAARLSIVQDMTERRVTIDAETHELVHQSIDARTNEVIDQLPDQTMLGLRAYFERMAEKAAARSAPGDGVLKVMRV